MAHGRDHTARGFFTGTRLAMAGMFLAALVPLLVTPVLPLIDFYDHLARFYVLSHLDSSAVLRQHYASHWALMPDIGTDVLATPLLRFIPPLLAGHVIVVLIMAVLYSGVLYFHHALTRQNSLLVAALLLPLLYSYILNWGFANFLLGLGFAFWAAGWWLSYRHRPWLAVPVASAFSVIVFLSHGMAFAVYGVITAALEIGFFLNAPGRKVSDLVRALSLLAIQAVIPFLLFVIWYTRHAPGDAVTLLAATSQQTLADARPIFPGYHRLSTILRVEEGPAFWFDAVTFAIQLAAIGFLIWRGKVAVARPVWPLIAILALFIVVTPSAMVGVYYIVDRIPLVLALGLLGALSIRPGAGTHQTRAALAILMVTVCVRLIAVAASWQPYRGDYKEFEYVAAKIPPGSLTLPVMVGSGHHETDVPRCEMYGPILIARHDQVGPLFAFQGQHPLLLTGSLKAATEALEESGPVPARHASNYNPYMRAAAAAGFDYLLVCNAHLLTHPYPAGLAVVAQTAHFAVLRAMR